MAPSSTKIDLTEDEIAAELVKRKHLSEGQLKAAMDYKESVGGDLLDVLQKLGLVRPSAIEEFLAKSPGSEKVGGDNSPAAKEPPIDVSKLKLHRKLLEKVPPELVEKHGMVFFFPPPGTRAILLSTADDAPDGLVNAMRELLGVEIRAIVLKPQERAALLGLPAAPAAPAPGAPTAGAPSGASSSEPAPRGRKSAPVKPAPAEAPDEHLKVLRGLINLLVRKQLITPDELRVELELMKHRNKGGP
jgi:hypothetical protein